MPNGIDHALRRDAIDELHARPFPVVTAPARAAFFAFTPPEGPQSRDAAAEWAHLLKLLDYFGLAHPTPGASHFSEKSGGVWLSWESHSEFTTYTAILDDLGKSPFDGSEFEVFPTDWMSKIPGVKLSSCAIRVEECTDTKAIQLSLKSWFEPESLSVSRVLDDAAVIAGDYRTDASGNLRFALFADPSTGPRRIGRIIQRLNEIEIYKSMSMLGLFEARKLSKDLSRVDSQLADLVADLRKEDVSAEKNLHDLLGISANLEGLSARVNYRFSASKAYAAIVNQRIEVLRERQFEGLQSFREFMMRRFDPSMRTVQAMDGRLQDLIARAIRTGNLLRTRVDVERQSESQELLESMNKRADLQLKLQKTVEGLSVVAISYYATALMVYVFLPVADIFNIPKSIVAASIVPFVIFGVVFALRRIRRRLPS